MPPTLHLLVGLPGSGKTTLARRLEQEHSALRLTPDEWMLPLFGAGESGGKRWVLESELLWSVAARALGLGVNVVLDYGLWSRSERDEFRARGEALGARVELHVLDVSREELWRRLEARNRDLPPHTFPVTPQELNEWIGWYEPPTPDELEPGRVHAADLPWGMTPPTLTELADWLSAVFGEPEPLHRTGPEGVARLALALEPADLPLNVAAAALFLHRARRVGDGWPGLGVLSVHDGFDLQLTTGPNRRLARVLGWTDLREVVWEGRIVGLAATPPQRHWPELRAALHAEVGGEDTSWPPDDSSSLRLALMNAMNPALVGHVADLGVRVYLTGQLRPSAAGAARERGLGVVALGHRRTELWGLRQLARELEAAFPGLQTEVHPLSTPGEALRPG